jgi:hypothetical protein
MVILKILSEAEQENVTAAEGQASMRGLPKKGGF